MKILYLCPDLGIPVLGRKGGAVHVREMVRAFGRAGHSVVLAAQTLNKSPWESPAELEAAVWQIKPAPGNTAAVLALKEFNQLIGVENNLPGELRRILYNKELHADLFRRFDSDPPDFIYERASIYATAGKALARDLKVPLILELNAPLAVEQSAYRATGFGDLAAQAERWTVNQADAVMVVSTALREHVLSLGVPSDRVHVLPNGVNPQMFRPGPADIAMRGRLGLNSGPVLGFVGGLRPWHGVEILPQVLERLLTTNRDLKLVIAGDGPLRMTLERGFEERGLQDHVVMTGLLPHEQVPEVIRQFDVALTPYPEPEHTFYFSPLKLFEYMGCGIAVVAPTLGQIPEIINDGQTGLLYPAGDLDVLTARCDQLLADRTLRQRLGNNAARLIQEHYTWDHNAARIVQLATSLGA